MGFERFARHPDIAKYGSYPSCVIKRSICPARHSATQPLSGDPPNDTPLTLFNHSSETILEPLSPFVLMAVSCASSTFGTPTPLLRRTRHHFLECGPCSPSSPPVHNTSNTLKLSDIRWNSQRYRGLLPCQSPHLNSPSHAASLRRTLFLPLPSFIYYKCYLVLRSDEVTRDLPMILQLDCLNILLQHPYSDNARPVFHQEPKLFRKDMV